MSDIIHLRGTPHEEAQRLLPWYVNDTLDPQDRAAVETHLATCAECRDELEEERALRAHIATIPVDASQGFAALRDQIEARKAAAPLTPANDTRPFLRRPVALGWALAAQAAMLALVIGLTAIPRQEPKPLYHALGSAPETAAGNVLAIFKPDLTEGDMRALLASVGAKVVEGPNASNAWVLRVPAANRAAALGKLRADGHVLLAEPVDPGS